MNTINLKTLTDIFREIANEQDWCDEAEDRFIEATGVTPLPWKARAEGCTVTYPPEGRFLLPADAPETVPAARIEEALEAYVRRSLGHCGCGDCRKYSAAEIAQLQRLADLLPGQPKLS